MVGRPVLLCIRSTVDPCGSSGPNSHVCSHGPPRAHRQAVASLHKHITSMRAGRRSERRTGPGRWRRCWRGTSGRRSRAASRWRRGAGRPAARRRSATAWRPSWRRSASGARPPFTSSSLAHDLRDGCGLRNAGVSVHCGGAQRAACSLRLPRPSIQPPLKVIMIPGV